MAIKREEPYSEELKRLFGIYYPDKGTMEATLQITEACSLVCKYCYEGHKSSKVMSLETAKKFIDVLFNEYQDSKFAIILDFIGGEPLLQPKLISDIIDYWDYKCIMENLIWGELTRFSICTNGTEYFKPEVQDLMRKMGNACSFTVSIDGNKELHDSARIHPDGSGSYDEAIAAANHYEKTNNTRLGSKMTIAPSNIIFLYPALKHYLDSGADIIYANCVYEDVWSLDDAKLFYQELKKVADYKLAHYPETYLSLFEEDFFVDIPLDNNTNYCGGRGAMLACDPDGILYPCLRYTPSAVGKDRNDYITCGTVDEGMKWEQIDELEKCTRLVITSKKCLECPIASGCGECFPAGTKILTPYGEIDIEDIKIGDEVYDMNGDIQHVSATMTRMATDLIYINDTIATYNHPFLLENGQWEKALNLKIGDKIKSIDNTTIEITNISILQNQTIQVYNFSVTNTESYIANNFIVHNCAALSWQATGRIDKRVDFICIMHQARALANVYYWNKYYQLTNQNKYFRNNVPEDWALQIIDREELKMLYEISGASR